MFDTLNNPYSKSQQTRRYIDTFFQGHASKQSFRSAISLSQTQFKFVWLEGTFRPKLSLILKEQSIDLGSMLKIFTGVNVVKHISGKSTFPQN